VNIQKSYVAAIVSTVLVCVGGLGCKDSSTPSSPSTTATTATATAPVNGAPVINSVNVTPDWGIAALQQHAFISDTSDPDDDTLTYRWEDSTGALLSVAANFVHTFNNLAGTETKEITLTVQDADGLSTSSSVTVTSISLTGTWAGHVGMPGAGSNPLMFFLTQVAGGLVTGTWDDSNHDGTLGPPGEPGTVSKEGEVRIRGKWNDSSPDFYFERDDSTTGSMINSTGTTLTGEINGSGVSDYTMIFTKQ
jgi:hypothetical protein